MLEGKKLTVYAGERRLLAGVTLKVGGGEVLAVLGPNGAGKTTLMRLLSLLRRPDDGVLLWQGEPADPSLARLRRKVGYLGHDIGLYDNLSGRENLRFFASLYGLGSRALEQHLLRRVGLEPFADDLVRTYSRGMRQRLGLARSLAHDPELWLLDEPYTGLDVRAAALLDDLITEQRGRGRVTVMVTHDVERAARLADHGLVIKAGRSVYFGEAREAAAELRRVLETGA